MAVQQNKMSKQKIRSRKGASRYQGIEVNVCTNCKAKRMPHCVCKACGHYNGKQVLSVTAE